MSDQDFKNPFSSLFPCPDEAEAFKAGVIPSQIPIDRPNKSGACSSQEEANIVMQTSDAESSTPDEKERHQTSHFYEEVFRITLSKDECCNRNGCPPLVFLNEVHVAMNYQTELDETCIDRAVFERILLGQPDQYLVYRKNSSQDDESSSEKKVIFYLYESYFRLKTSTHNKIGPYETANHVILTQTASALCNPEMFPDAKLAEDLIKLLFHYYDQFCHCDILSQFLADVASSLVELEISKLSDVFKPAFVYLQEKLAAVTLIDRNLYTCIDVLNYFTGSDHLIKALIQHSTPKEIKNGKSYQNSLLGLPLAVSCLPKSEFEKYEFFQDPSKYSNHEHSITEERLSMPLASLAKSMHAFFEKILRKSAESRELLLQWFGNCLDANSGRAKIWNSQLPEVYASLHGSDGFILNLLAVLLLFSKPFAQPCSEKLFKVNPFYCSSPPSTEAKRNGVHLKSLVKETCLLPRDEPMETEENTVYNFITECFFLTHYAFRIGFHVVNEKMIKQNQELVRTQRVYEETRIQGGESSDIGQQLKEKMERGMTKFLSYRTALLVPETLDRILKFQIATASWLLNLSTPEECNIFKTMKFPPTDQSSTALAYVPEFILENVIDCVLFLKRYSVKSFELVGSDIDQFMTLVLMFMGSPERVKNPHLRAHLAEMLESLMPEEDQNSSIMCPSVFRHKLFTSHLYVEELIPTLLNVFVSIEMTGQSVAFEQKFQYRRPMYIALDYLWNFDTHKRRMKELADIAEKNMESSRPPIFLHFINLLINDAIFLLDEALTYMSKLRETQQARDNGAWSSLTPDQQQQQEGNFHHMGLLAKFHNVMSNETINTLQWLTTDIKSIFCHPTIVERIAAMLNYFLLTLVGPLKKNFKVKDLKEYEFKPQELVRDISQIYCNLGAMDTQHAKLFCGAISRDGRSYTPELFPLAQTVLTKIGDGVLASQLDVISEKVHKEAVKQKQDDELQTGAPDEFLDPIMSTLMKDPVKLPSSGMSIDRATIARHLLSDQTDPFNRSPLTMDMVVPDDELRQKIEKWLTDKRALI